ncbi:Hsp20/alpha crystallin family protein [Paenibacillus ginsengarvi]|uniref:Hsp20/alpha crystallin family protein n=1 Tax=Paenibacillus ginsengarvi TaxID=400777 RepID=A0A3B0CN67_9BACL|nr:Hsp20/alpha crystallin family protein [Paenibacillus ginsengarvi]RKN86400.1 hypothetical protein D7M11_00050 [Paenibacillus ginsengarvi]
MGGSDEEASPGQGPGVFNWEQFQNSFFGGAGWKQVINENGTGSIPWLDRYVKSILVDTAPGASAVPSQPVQPFTSKTSSFTYNVFETHRSLIVRIRLSSETNPRTVRIVASTTEVKVTGLPDGEDKTVKLPMPVRIDGAKALCKKQIIEITLPKDELPPVKEIPLRFMEGE